MGDIWRDRLFVVLILLALVGLAWYLVGADIGRDEFLNMGRE